MTIANNLGIAWKVRRELTQLKNRLVFLALRPFEILYAKRLKTKEVSGEPLRGAVNRQPQERYAIFVIYQPTGLKGSTIETLNYLSESGYYCCVVANGGLPETSVEALNSFPGVLIQRPNFGRDFGAYQAGWHYLRDKKYRLAEILFLNDSVWFPMLFETDVFEGIDRNHANVTAFSNLGRISQSPDALLLASYFLHFRGTAQVLSLLDGFWRSYVASNFHHYTMKAGERHLSNLIKSSGLKWDALFTNQALYEALDACSNEELYRVLKFASYQDATLSQYGESIVRAYNQESGKDHWRIQALAHAWQVLDRRSGLASFSVGCLSLLRLDCIKRGSTVLQRQARRAISEAHEHGHLPGLRPSVANEIKS
jgi:hypothetical protein